MDEIQVKILGAKLGKGIIENGFDVLGSMEVVPKLTDKDQYPDIQTKEGLALDVSQSCSRGTSLAFRALPTSASFWKALRTVP